MLTSLLAGWFFYLAGATNIQSNICHSFPSAPNVQAPASGLVTQDRQVIVEGTADSGDTITVQENNVTIASTTADTGGSFGLTINLNIGADSIDVVASNACQDTAAAGPILVTYDPPAVPPSGPSLLTPEPVGQHHILAPGQSQTTRTHQTTQTAGLSLTVFTPHKYTTTSPSVDIAGNTNMAATITITDNNRQVARLTTTGSNYFAALVPVQPGVNNVLVSAAAGSATAAIPLEITRTAPQPPAVRHKPTVWWYAVMPVLVAVLGTLVAIEIRKKRYHDLRGDI